MDRYQVTYEDQNDQVDTTQVWSSSREEATYAAFNELSDREITVRLIVGVSLWDDGDHQWVPIAAHRQVTA